MAANHRIPFGDVLIHSGDATDGRTADACEREMTAFADALSLLPHAEKIVVPGNHDIPHPTNPNSRHNACSPDSLAVVCASARS